MEAHPQRRNATTAFNPPKAKLLDSAARTGRCCAVLGTTLGSDSETAMAPTDPVFKKPSVTFCHVSPPSVVFHRPQPAP